MKKICIMIGIMLSMTVLVNATQEGSLPGVFSVSKTKKVHFSQGNLQYQASTNTWRLANYQWTAIGDDNERISATWNGWIDLFGWGTSGWNSGAKCYQPWCTSTSSYDYYPGGKAENNLWGACANADWGVYNSIVNGGSQPGLWYTLRQEEWYYLLYNRENAENLCGHGTVNGVTGFIFLPDNWQCPSGLEWTPMESDVFDKWTFNVYSAAQWTLMEQTGAVFLPCTGSRLYGDQVYYATTGGSYWSSSACGSYDAYAFTFSEKEVNASYNYYRYDGFAVRLVCDADGSQIDYTPKNLQVLQEGNIVYFMWDYVYGAALYDFILKLGETVIDSLQTKQRGVGLDFTGAKAGAYPVTWSVRSLDANGTPLSDYATANYTIQLTAIEEVEAGNAVQPFTKVLKDGRVYIVRGNHKYTVTGQEIR